MRTFIVNAPHMFNLQLEHDNLWSMADALNQYSH